MSEVTRRLIARVGVDIAKQVIHVHAVDGAGRRVVARALKRDQFLPWCAQHLPAGCVVAMEACSGAHHWARQLMAMGFAARLIAPHLVTPYRMEGRGGKNDATDAAHILGGALIVSSADMGVVDARSGACGYRNPIVCNGPILPANLGVNPCLTITALAEHIMSRAPPAPTAVTPGGTS